MLEKRSYYVGDIFRVYDKSLEKDKFVVLSRFVFKAEHFVLLSINTLERWTDRELTFRNEFEKTYLSKEEIMYLYGDEQIAYIGNMSSISKAELYEFIDSKLSKAKAV
ncbi:MAG: hypothetical protein C0603_12535 [Denitrovibrio sp.]|nr:MAG: hypothetical protein C0603_12535 [Denitrovibrio sp.]